MLKESEPGTQGVPVNRDSVGFPVDPHNVVLATPVNPHNDNMGVPHQSPLEPPDSSSLVTWTVGQTRVWGGQMSSGTRSTWLSSSMRPPFDGGCIDEESHVDEVDSDSHLASCNDPAARAVQRKFCVLQPSGVFFALKIQAARNQAHLESLVKEVENLTLLKDKPGITQLRDFWINEKSLHLIILLELGACDLHAFLSGAKNYCLDVRAGVTRERADQHPTETFYLIHFSPTCHTHARAIILFASTDWNHALCHTAQTCRTIVYRNAMNFSGRCVPRPLLHPMSSS